MDGLEKSFASFWPAGQKVASERCHLFRLRYHSSSNLAQHTVGQKKHAHSVIRGAKNEWITLVDHRINPKSSGK